LSMLAMIVWLFGALLVVWLVDKRPRRAPLIDYLRVSFDPGKAYISYASIVPERVV